MKLHRPERNIIMIAKVRLAPAVAGIARRFACACTGRRCGAGAAAAAAGAVASAVAMAREIIDLKGCDGAVRADGCGRDRTRQSLAFCRPIRLFARTWTRCRRNLRKQFAAADRRSRERYRHSSMPRASPKPELKQILLSIGPRPERRSSRSSRDFPGCGGRTERLAGGLRRGGSRPLSCRDEEAGA